MWRIAEPAVTARAAKVLFGRSIELNSYPGKSAGLEVPPFPQEGFLMGRSSRPNIIENPSSVHNLWLFIIREHAYNVNSAGKLSRPAYA
jgi:hypothetical protein